MGKTPKLQKKSSLSLTSRISNKRYGDSPKHRIRTVLKPSNTEGTSSPTILSTSADGGIECTPPHKKLNFDDSLDYSQATLDCSFSPSGMFSQTLAIESPEVCWKWNREVDDVKLDKTNGSTATPDSAYAADSSFTSIGSNSAKCGGSNVRTRSYDKRREDKRRAMEQQLRKAEQIKQNEMLKQRCARLQQQMNEAQSNVEAQEKQKENFDTRDTPIRAKSYRISKKASPKIDTSPVILQNKKISTLPANKTLNDFFNDSDSDCLLLEATQQVESKIVEYTEESVVLPVKLNSIKSPKTVPNTAPPVISTPTSRSSFYSKFLEDDSPDDWFVSLDEVILQATQNKKPRTSFQRHNSMPSETLTTVAKTAGSVREEKNNNSTIKSAGMRKSLKRHVSSTHLSPSSSSSIDSMEGHLSFCKEMLKKSIETVIENTNCGFRQGENNAIKF